jgi:general secretion pathway protein H
MRPAPRLTSAGFTLIEIIVVMVVMALVAGLVVTNGRVHSTRIDMEAAQRALIASLRLARGRAIATDRIVAVQTTQAGYALDGGPLQALPNGLSLTAATIAFTPDGLSSGGQIVMVSPTAQQRIAVDWLTGRVTSTPAFSPSANP